nr:MAG TPA: hypothetical protein [Caudoviricetes sp.]
MLRNRSVATIDSPEFINLAPDAINPGISKCEIKVMYLGKNRNGSFIDKNTAIQMANSLPATPIVAAYNENKEDFGDHGEVLHIEDGEVKFSCKTVPYGFVAPDADVWFQKFDDTNELGETTTREYMMTTGYLWTGQYPELDKCINQGQGQSMEIDDVDGHWTKDSNDIEFFIINDAIFTKLCILGDDVEPCFEGASVTSPEVSEHFSYNKEFSHTLFAMMNELKSALTKGGSMPKENVEVEPTAAVEEEAPVVEEFAEDVETNEDVESSEDSAEETFAEEGKKKEDDSEDSDDESDDSDDDEYKKKPGKKCELENQVSELSEQLKELTDKFTALEAEAEELRKFKAERIDADKDAMIAKYHMLSDEDKAEIIADKDKFTLGEIESKLALLYVQKNVNFDDEEEIDSTPLTTFSLDDETVAEDADPILSALREAQNY